MRRTSGGGWRATDKVAAAIDRATAGLDFTQPVPAAGGAYNWDCSMHIEVREPKTAEEFDLYYDLRWHILREPWRRGRESARDGLEEGAFHLMALRDGTVVGVGRLHFNSTDEAQVRYMAVDAGQQRHGIGSRILERLEQHAREHGVKRVVLNAREGAIPFYRRHGYELEGAIETAFECVPHWRMTKAV